MPVKIKPAEAARLGITAPKKRGQKVKTQKVNPEVFKALCRVHGLPEPVAEWSFCGRKWRFDWTFWPERGQPVALEIDGAAWTQGRHTRGKGFIADQEKMNEAVCLGYRVIHCVPDDVKSGKVFGWLTRALREKNQ